MIKSFLLSSALFLPFATGIAFNESKALACANGNKTACQELIAERCDAGGSIACRRLAIETAGQCASPGYLGGCFYDSND